MPERSVCLDENAVDAFLSGHLDEAAAALVDAHVDTCPDCLVLIATLAKSRSILHEGEPPEEDDELPIPSNDALARGTRIGRYEIEALVGVGSMGAVYAAVDPDLHRTVALKLVRARRGGDANERKERLLREARTMARLAHPNVVAVHDVGTFGERVFVAMDLIEGETLRQWLDQPRATKDILATFVAAGHGLAAAHDAKVVHRDFKPENVLVGRDGRVLVTDFGLARDPGSEEERQGTVAGTPAYMAPEQLRGEEVDARADQFSFCVALHEALVGERPFRGRSPAELLASIEEQAIDARLASRAPAHVRRALRRGLARSPEARFPSIGVLLRELSRDPAARARRIGLAAAGAIALVAIGAFATSAVRRERASCREGVPTKLHAVWTAAQRSAIHDAFLATKMPYAEDAWTRVARGLDNDAASWSAMHTEACDATHVRAEQSAELLDLRVACLDEHLGEMRSLIDVLEHADANTVKNATAAVHSLAPLRRCADAFALRAIASPPSERADAINALRADLARAKALRDAGHVRESLALAKAAAKTSVDLAYVPLQAVAFLRVGEAEMEARDAEAASDTLRQVANLADTAKDDLTRAHALTRRLFVEGFMLRHGDRITELDAAAAAAIGRIGGDVVELEGNRRHALGMALAVKGSLPEATAALEDAVKLRERAHGAKSREVAMSHNGLCLVASKRGEREKALAECQHAIDIWTEILGPSHPDIAIGLSNLGALFVELNRYEEACDRFDRSLAITEAALGPDSPLVAITLTNLGEALSKRGDHERAIATLLRAVRLREKLPEPNELRMELLLTNLGEAYLRSNDAERARETFELAQKRTPSTVPEEDRIDTTLGLATALWESKDAATRQRARKIVTDARRAMSQSATRGSELDTWLAQHP